MQEIFVGANKIEQSDHLSSQRSSEHIIQMKKEEDNDFDDIFADKMGPEEKKEKMALEDLSEDEKSH